MGFYSPATIVKDAQRHGLKVLPIDVTKSEWNCTLELVPSPESRIPSEIVAGQYSLPRKSLVIPTSERTRGAEESLPAKLELQNSQLTPVLRMGLRYVQGLREDGARSLLFERIRAPFTSIHDLTRRVPELRKDELTTLAEIGALNPVGHKSGQRFLRPSLALGGRNDKAFACDTRLGTRDSGLHRRDALWQVERAVRASGPLLEQQSEPDAPSPLAPMSEEERLVADFHGTGVTVGPHPMAYRREWLNAMCIRRASELSNLPSGKRLRIGGCVIVRQRPGTAKGFVFLSLEDETGVANAIITPDLFHQNRLLLASEKFLAIEGILQNQDNVISVKAERVQPLFVTKAETVSHDFH